jgi:ribosomal protein S18 acetylase RimI-like enzyme
MEVVLASSGDTNELASVLATAYRDNPLFRWMFAEELDLDLLRTIFVSLVEGALPQQCVYKTSQNTGAAIWALPRTDTPPPNLRQSGQDLTTSSGRRAEALQILGAHRPAEPHLYLAAVGVLPTERRRGSATALLAAVLEGRDAALIDIYLENSDPENTSFYEGLGFRSLGVLPRPEGCPPVVRMIRRA